MTTLANIFLTLASLAILGLAYFFYCQLMVAREVRKDRDEGRDE